MTLYFHSVTAAMLTLPWPAGSVLVHCVQGVSRSVSMVIAYLMKHKKWSYDQALAFVRSKRPQAKPNPAFAAQLQQYERRLLAEQQRGRSRGDGRRRNSIGAQLPPSIAAKSAATCPVMGPTGPPPSNDAGDSDGLCEEVAECRVDWGRHAFPRPG